CHEPTLRSVTRGPVFERLVVPPGCTVMSKLDSPVEEDPSDLAFVDRCCLTVMYPKLRRDPSWPYPGPTELELDQIHVQLIESGESPWRYKTGEMFWKELPTLGYLITDRASGLSFYHPGDLHEAFDSQRELRGRVDYMFFPLGKLDGVERTVLENIR